MVKSGNTTGNIAMVETDEIFAIWSPLALIRCNSTMILPRYLYLFMQSQFFQTNVNLSASYGTQPNIGMGVIENLPVTYPATLTEQQEIVEQLSDRLIEINTLIAKAEQFIERLREHRTALIAAAVTGKIDVRAVGEGVKGRGDKMTR
jgi:type I restriction enzyme S subunit